jgi:hypothetical protein
MTANYMISDDSTLTPDDLINEYRRLYTQAHGADPIIYYMGFGWYTLNNEVVHRRLVLEDMVRMSETISLRTRLPHPKPGIVQKLIEKLRGM